MTSQRMKDKVALVTGGASGIGRSICLRFAAEGAAVLVLDLAEKGQDAADKIREAGGRAHFLRCDVGEQAEVKSAVAEGIELLGRIDVLVNSAGISHIGTVESTTESELDRLYRVNVKGTYNTMHAVVPRMVARGEGVILNLASILSKLAVEERFAYGMSKGAVLSMTLSVARDYIHKGIRCNCICPARIHTEFVDGYLAQHYPGREKEMLDKLGAFQPIGRMGEPDEVAALVLFLCSDEASFITGSAYDIDGGVTLLR